MMRKANETQQEIDFDRAGRLAALEGLSLQSMEVIDGKARVRVSAKTLKSVLMRIASHQWTSGVCWASASTIAGVLNCHERTVRRACIGLVDLQLLLVLSDRPGVPVRYGINWGEIAARESGRPTPNPGQNVRGNPGHSDTNPGHSDTNPGHSDTNPGHSDTNPGHYVRRTKRTLKNLTTSTTDQPSSERAAYGGAPDPWAVVVSAFVELGMSDAHGAVGLAQQRGLAPADVQALIAEYVQLTAADSRVTIGYLHRWISGKSRPPSADRPRTAVRPRNVSLTSETTRREVIRAKIVRAGRRAGDSEEAIATRVRAAWAKMAEADPRSDAAMQARRTELLNGFTNA